MAARVFIVIFLLFLVGCAVTNAQRHRQQLFGKVKAEFLSASRCYDDLGKDRKYDFLYSNLALKRKLATSDELSNTTKVDDAGISLFLDWYALHQRCDTTFLNNLGEIDPELQLLAVGWFQDRAALIDKAITSRPTYGLINAELDLLKQKEKATLGQWLTKRELQFKDLERQEIGYQVIEVQKRNEFLKGLADDIIEGLVALGKIQSDMASKQVVIVNNPQPIQPITPTLINANCRKFVTGNVSCTIY